MTENLLAMTLNTPSKYYIAPSVHDRKIVYRYIKFKAKTKFIVFKSVCLSDDKLREREAGVLQQPKFSNHIEVMEVIKL